MMEVTLSMSKVEEGECSVRIHISKLKLSGYDRPRSPHLQKPYPIVHITLKECISRKMRKARQEVTTQD